MGLLSPKVTGHPLVWFRQDHPLQKHEIFHLALKTGFCGCITTCKFVDGAGDLQYVALLRTYRLSKRLLACLLSLSRL